MTSFVEKDTSESREASATRLTILLGILVSAISVAYFVLIDRVIFSTSHFTSIFKVLLAVYDGQTAWLSITVCLVATAWRKPVPVLRLVDFIVARRYWIFAGVAVLLSLCCIVIYHSYSLSMDEYAAVFQSKIFAGGHLYAQLPPAIVNWLVVPGFNGSFLFASTETGKAIEGYWPGFALLLAPFQLLGVAWLCNALLASLALYLIFSITVRVTGDARCGGWALLFTIASGAYVANAISFYSMQAHLTANLLFVWLLMTPTPKRALGAGLVGSLALILHNPMPHALFALPWILSMFVTKDQRRFVIPLALGYLPGIAALLGWLVLRATILPATHELSDVTGISHGIFVVPDELVLQMRAASLAKLWVWAMPCLFVFAVTGYIRLRHDRTIRTVALSAALTFVAYLFVRLDQGHGWGYRYFHSAWGAMPILAGCAMSGKPNARLISFAGALAVLSLALLVPFQLHQIEGIIARHLAQLPPPRRPGNNIYFVPVDGGSYMADMIQIDPLLHEKDLVLMSRGAKLDAELVRQNWPDAVVINRGFWARQLYLGAEDKRQLTEQERIRHFVIVYQSARDTTRP